VIIKKRQKRRSDVDAVAISLLAKGSDHRGISAQFAEVYGASFSKDTVSRVTDAVVEGLVGKHVMVQTPEGVMVASCHEQRGRAQVELGQALLAGYRRGRHQSELIPVRLSATCHKTDTRTVIGVKHKVSAYLEEVPATSTIGSAHAVRSSWPGPLRTGPRRLSGSVHLGWRPDLLYAAPTSRMPPRPPECHLGRAR